MKATIRLGHPLFILTIILLLLNDFYLKATFHNELTGKLSDFAGLFAFPFFFAACFPKQRIAIHIMTALLFLFWNSGLSEPIINGLNSLGWPAGRTIDFSDNLALFSILLSYQVGQQKRGYFSLPPLLFKGLAFVACFAFVATSQVYHPYAAIPINKSYHFEFSKKKLIERFNMVQLDEIQQMRRYGAIDFNAGTNTFHYQGEEDTLVLLLDYRQLANQDTIEYKSTMAKMHLFGNDEKSTIIVEYLYKMGPIKGNKNYYKKTIRAFEKRIIQGIKAYNY